MWNANTLCTLLFVHKWNFFKLISTPHGPSATRLATVSNGGFAVTGTFHMLMGIIYCQIRGLVGYVPQCSHKQSWGEELSSLTAILSRNYCLFPLGYLKQQEVPHHPSDWRVAGIQTMTSRTLHPFQMGLMHVEIHRLSTLCLIDRRAKDHTPSPSSRRRSFPMCSRSRKRLLIVRSQTLRCAMGTSPSSSEHHSNSHPWGKTHSTRNQLRGRKGRTRIWLMYAVCATLLNLHHLLRVIFSYDSTFHMGYFSSNSTLQCIAKWRNWGNVGLDTQKRPACDICRSLGRDSNWNPVFSNLRHFHPEGSIVFVRVCICLINFYELPF